MLNKAYRDAYIHVSFSYVADMPLSKKSIIAIKITKRVMISTILYAFFISDIDTHAI